MNKYYANQTERHSSALSLSLCFEEKEKAACLLACLWVFVAMGVRSMFRTATKLVAGTTLLGGGAAIATSDNPSTAFKLCTNVPVRLVRDCFTAALVAFGPLSLSSLYMYFLLLLL